MTRPVRLQLSRKKGFDLRAASLALNGLPAVNVARPGRWGNPYRVGGPDPFRPIGNWMTAERAVELYRWGVENGFVTVPYTALTHEERGDGYRSFGAHSVTEVAHKLRGHNLACWCAPDAPCHADILLDLANRDTTPVSAAPDSTPSEPLGRVPDGTGTTGELAGFARNEPASDARPAGQTSARAEPEERQT